MHHKTTFTHSFLYFDSNGIVFNAAFNTISDFYHSMATAQIVHVFPGFHQYCHRALKYLAQRDAMRKSSGSSKGQTRDLQVTSHTFITDSNRNLSVL